jgi:hypothetical protein
VVADLLELGEQLQDPSAPLDPVAEVGGEDLVDHRLVQGGLLACQRAGDGQLGLVRQVGAIVGSALVRRSTNGPVSSRSRRVASGSCQRVRSARRTRGGTG